MASRVIIYLLICLMIASSEGFLFDFDAEPEWDTLQITYPLYSKMPLTRKDAESQNFEQIGGKDAPCEGAFSGYRYMKKDDPSIIMLYDVNGYLAGTQTSYLEKGLTKEGSLRWFKQSPMFTVEELLINNEQLKSYTLTAYLVDPKTICSTGRTAQEFKDSKGGTDLYLKNGTSVVAIPKQQKDLEGTSWTKGRCFPSMGVHYWYDTSKDMNCDYFQPIFLLYNKKELTGFGWAVFAYFPTIRYEHPPKISFGAFFETIPKCVLSEFDKEGGISTQHVYMNTDLLNLLC